MYRSLLLMLLVPLGTLVAQPSVTTISGRLLGGNGRPMPKAHVHLVRSERGYISMAQTDSRGYFTISTERIGRMTLRASGVGHEPYELPMLIGAPRAISLEITLAPRSTPASYDGMKVVGDFNGFNPATARPLARQTDGTYMISIPFPPKRKVFAYRLLASHDSSIVIDGIGAYDYDYDGEHGYRSVILGRDGKATVVFDPRQLPHAETGRKVVYHDSLSARLGAVMEEIEHNRQMIRTRAPRWTETGKVIADSTHDWSTVMKRLLEQACAEEEPSLRTALLIEYADLVVQGVPPIDTGMARQLLQELPQTTGFWDTTSFVLDADSMNHDAATQVKAFRQGYRLLSFWATWCVYCIWEIEELERAYERYHERNLEIISISLDENPRDLERFRQRRWKMPWQQMVADGGFQSAIARRFDLQSIPALFLVDPNGIIVASGAELRGDKLQRTLARFLDGAR